MSRKFLTGVAVLAVATSLVAHHVSVGLSSPFGVEVLDEIVLYHATGNLGVPAHITGADEHGYHIHDGTTFHATDGSTTETITFSDSDFVDVHHATADEIATAINAQATLFEAAVINDSVVLRGLQGGGDAMLQLTDDVGAPLVKLGLTTDIMLGADDIELTLSVSDDDHTHEGDDHLAGQPYLVVASTTEGVIPVAGFEVPIAYDETTAIMLRATELGLLEGFLGNLDDHQDATAFVPTEIFGQLGGDDHLPEQVFFAYVVFSDDLQSIDYVSNRFTVNVVAD